MKRDSEDRRYSGIEPLVHPGSSPELPMLVYIPGLDGTGQLLYKQIPALSRRFRVVTFRLPDDEDATHERITSQVARLIQELGEKRVTILGDSFGGTIALTLARSHPLMVERLILVNSFARFHERAAARRTAGIVSLLPFKLTWFFRRALDSLGLLFDRVGREDRRRFFKIIAGVNKQGYVRRLELIGEFDIGAGLRDIKAPTLIVAGEKDNVVGAVRQAVSMAAQIPNASVRIIPGAGHACLLSDQFRLASTIGEWLDAESIETAGTG